MPRVTKSSFLAGGSPLATLAVSCAALVPVLLAFDAYTPLPYTFFGLLQILVLGRVSMRRLMRVMGPLLLLPAGLFVLNLFFSAPVAHDVLLRFGSLRIPANSLHRALVLSLRSLALIVISAGYLLVTEPKALVNALMQQLRLAPRIGYAVYVAWNTIPVLRESFRHIENAHRIRLRGARRTVRDLLPTAVALLTGAIRYAERATLSMAARGIESGQERSFLYESRFKTRDAVYVGLSLAIIGGIWCLLIVRGLFVFGLG
jgi:energy-coupling factor transport system permease protein